MPDWITHIAVAYSVAVLAGVKKRELVVLGALLPDIFKVFIPVGAFLGYGQAFFMGNYFAPFHTALGVILSSTLVSTFFSDHRKVLTLLLIGATTHLIMDSLLYPFGYENWFFWPLFSFKTNGIIWPDSFKVTLAAISTALTLTILKDRILGSVPT